MDNLAESNKFIELFEKLYDALYITDPENIDETNLGDIDFNVNSILQSEAKSTKKSFWPFKKEEPEAAPIDLVELVYQEIKNYLDNILSNPAQTFWTLWKICQFIRWAEKILIYENNPENAEEIFVDSEQNADERCFRIKLDKVTLSFILRLVPKNSYSLTESKYSEVISILIESLTGKKMVTKIISVDQEVDLSDDGDLYLINQVNKYINKAIKKTFEVILEGLLVDTKHEGLINQKPLSSGFYYKNI